jgi:hypothetical protein
MYNGKNVQRKFRRKEVGFYSFRPVYVMVTGRPPLVALSSMLSVSPLSMP